MLNIGAAINKMRDGRVVTAKSRHQCAFAVRTFLEAGGMSTAGRPGFAWAYRLWLPTKGFAHIATITGKAVQAQWTARNARPGDIAVMPHGVYGHICMWSGSRWVSDFPQNNMWVYGGDGPCMIFRYGGQMVPFQPEEPPIDIKPVLTPLNDLAQTLRTNKNAVNKLKKHKRI